MGMNDINSLSHSKWNCKYHIVFAPNYRRQIIYGKIKQDIGQVIRKLCEYKGVEIYISTVGKNKKVIAQYIRNQLQKDYAYDQMSINKYVDPFTGEPIKEGKWK